MVSKLGWQLVDAFECGLLCNKMREYLATSLDGWLVIKNNELSDYESSFHSDSEEDAISLDHPQYNCDLEIKTLSSKKIIQDTIKKCIDVHSQFSQCEFGTPAFKQLVYKPEYRTQVLHYATVANLKYVLFVVAGTTKVHYAVLIQFPKEKPTCLRSIHSSVYQQSLKWAYTNAWTSNDSGSCMSLFHEDVI